MIRPHQNRQSKSTTEHRLAAITAIAITLLQLVALQRLTCTKPAMERPARPTLQLHERIASRVEVQRHTAVPDGADKAPAHRRGNKEQRARAAPAYSPALVDAMPSIADSPAQETARSALAQPSAGISNWRVEDPAAAPSTLFRKEIMSRDAPTLDPPRSNGFSMKPQLTPRDIVRGASQLLGFWPPGYSDNPCGGLDRSVQQLSSAANASERRQLSTALELRQKHCR